MPRRVEDIVPNERRSVRDIAPVRKPAMPLGARPIHSERTIPINRLKVTPPHHPGNAPRRHRKGRWKWVAAVLLIIAVVAASAYAASTRFARATFKISPVVIPVQADTTLVAAATTTPGYIAYKAIKFSDTAMVDVPAVDGPLTSTKASGRVTLYNAYSAQPQRLLAGTRMTDGSGLIYRLTSSVVIPGYSGPAQTPGKLSAAIVADQPGAQYNVTKASSPGKWKMVAYEGGPRYETVYAYLATDITGGFQGQKKTVSPALLASSTEQLQAALTQRLFTEAKAAVPDGYILYDSAYKANFAQPVVGGATSGKATISVSGTLYAAALKVSDLAAKLAGADRVASFGGFPYATPGLESLSFNIVNQADFSPSKGTTMIVRMKGSLKLVGTVPVEALRDKLLGLPLRETQKVLESYKAVIDVSKSSGEIFPSWTATVPNDKDRVSVTLLTQ